MCSFFHQHFPVNKVYWSIDLVANCVFKCQENKKIEKGDDWNSYAPEDARVEFFDGSRSRRWWNSTLLKVLWFCFFRNRKFSNFSSFFLFREVKKTFRARFYSEIIEKILFDLEKNCLHPLQPQLEGILFAEIEKVKWSLQIKFFTYR